MASAFSAGLTQKRNETNPLVQAPGHNATASRVNLQLRTSDKYVQRSASELERRAKKISIRLEVDHQIFPAIASELEGRAKCLHRIRLTARTSTKICPAIRLRNSNAEQKISIKLALVRRPQYDQRSASELERRAKMVRTISLGTSTSKQDFSINQAWSLKGRSLRARTAKSCPAVRLRDVLGAVRAAR